MERQKVKLFTWILFLVSTVVLIIVMLNFLIAIVSGTYVMNFILIYIIFILI